MCCTKSGSIHSLTYALYVIHLKYFLHNTLTLYSLKAKAQIVEHKKAEVEHIVHNQPFSAQ